MSYRQEISNRANTYAVMERFLRKYFIENFDCTIGRVLNAFSTYMWSVREHTNELHTAIRSQQIPDIWLVPFDRLEDIRLGSQKFEKVRATQRDFIQDTPLQTRLANTNMYNYLWQERSSFGRYKLQNFKEVVLCPFTTPSLVQLLLSYGVEITEEAQLAICTGTNTVTSSQLLVNFFKAQFDFEVVAENVAEFDTGIPQLLVGVLAGSKTEKELIFDQAIKIKTIQKQLNECIAQNNAYNLSASNDIRNFIHMRVANLIQGLPDNWEVENDLLIGTLRLTLYKADEETERPIDTCSVNYYICLSVSELILNNNFCQVPTRKPLITNKQLSIEIESMPKIETIPSALAYRAALNMITAQGDRRIDKDSYGGRNILRAYHEKNT